MNQDELNDYHDLLNNLNKKEKSLKTKLTKNIPRFKSIKKKD